MTPFGDRAVRFAIPSPHASDARRRRSLFVTLSRITGVVDVVLAETIGCVVFAADADRTFAESEIERVLGTAARVDAMLDVDDANAPTAHDIRVVYDGEDLDAVAHAIGRTKDAVIALHSEREYRVSMLGFLPGFAYLRGLAEELRLPRRAPRPRVVAGSVAIAAEYTGIYPFASPGGWHLLGRAIDFHPFDVHTSASGDVEGRVVLAIGDVVRFSPSSEMDGVRAVRRPTGSIPQRSLDDVHGWARPHLEIARMAGFAILVDGGRPGRMHEGIPPGGPLVRSMLERANALAGNESCSTACAIELSGSIDVVARGGRVILADDEKRIVLEEGQHHVVSTAGLSRVRYLAVAGGGIDAPILLGGRGALLVANMGRLLRRGDRIAAPSLSSFVTASSSAFSSPSSTSSSLPSKEVTEEGKTLAIMDGVDAAPGFSIDMLTSRAFRISSASDRTGTRLEGDEGGDAAAVRLRHENSKEAHASAPMVMGAIELTPSGLVVFGPDHPTTGGYPVIAVLRSGSFDAFFSRPIGSLVRFLKD